MNKFIFILIQQSLDIEANFSILMLFYEPNQFSVFNDQKFSVLSNFSNVLLQ